ncbi:MAG: TonB-dependent receptor [Thermoanaerobaculia bacterium]|jgi:outer membrane cobalamin receptor
MRACDVAAAITLSVMVGLPCSAPAQELDDLSLEELMNVPVVSASNVSERLGDAPATVIVVTRAEIRERGYRELSAILDDLPGMEMVRPRGDTWFKNYWRGYRNTIGDPFLVMVDGLVFNHLYFNTADILAAIPISNVDRVEVVYGPASAVYGANASMGVVNVITGGTASRLDLTGGSDEARIADATFAWAAGATKFRLTARVDNGELDPGVSESYEYTKKRYYRDRALWGGFLDNPDFGGDFRSKHENRGFDLRVALGGIEAGLQYFRTSSGYGVEYAADQAQNNAVWSRPELSAFVRDMRDLRKGVRATTTVRYRSSDVENDSYFVAAASGNGQPRLVDFSLWQTLNESITVAEDLDIALSPTLALKTGLEFEQKDLQKAYEAAYGPALPPLGIDVATYPYPEPPDDSVAPNNSITTEDLGGYVQLRWAFVEGQRLNLGIRVDDNSKYGTATTLRAGWLGTFERWTFRALYGEAFQEPNQRLLYGGWDGSGSDPTLDPETSRTLELSASWTTPRLSGLASLWAVRNHDTFVNTASGAGNLGEREVSGIDLHGQAIVRGTGRTRVKAWGYYSRILHAREDQHTPTGAISGDGPIPDLAENKFWLGTTVTVDERWIATLRGRWVGSRDTIVSNPVRQVDSFATIDLNLVATDLASTGIGVSLSVENLFDEEYFHPGIRDANAGTTPGYFDSGGNWRGSSGFFNSLLPQPGRSVLLTLRFER